jgi:hypothetical protein
MIVPLGKTLRKRRPRTVRGASALPAVPFSSRIKGTAAFFSGDLYVDLG